MRISKGLLTSDWETTETPSLLQRLRLGNGSLRRDDDGVKDEAVLKTLDLADHLGLIILGAVVVNHTKTSQESNVNGHVVLSHCVHGRGDKWSLEGDTLRDRCVESDFSGREA